jgi:DNA polymerase-3 subunit epsilon
MIDREFTAIDFETADTPPYSICQVGLVRVVDQQVTEKVNLLVQPPQNRYFHRNIDVHGIRPTDTRDAPTFDQIWEQIRRYIEEEVVVAHNVNFDANCLRSTLHHYGLEVPDFEERCTRTIYGRGLSFLAGKYRIPLQHHDALSDAHACAQLYIKYQAKKLLPKTGSLF